MLPKTLNKDSIEYKRLQEFADALNAYGCAHYFVKDVYWDIGQDWVWTTIVAEKDFDDNRSWQALYPKLWENVITAKYDEEHLVDEYFSDKYCQDERA